MEERKLLERQEAEIVLWPLLAFGVSTCANAFPLVESEQAEVQ